MAGVGLGGVGLAEVYAMRALHKEKMKKTMAEQKQIKADEDVVIAADEADDHDYGKKKNQGSSRCFLWGSASCKKTRSAKVSSR